VLEHPCSAGTVLRILREAVPQEAPPSFEPDEVLGTSPAGKLLRDQVKRLAAADPHPILFQGEEGTGRSFLALSVHRHSARRNLPVRTVDCAALPKGILEFELFGRNAHGSLGASEATQSGVLLIQNLEELPPALQGRLLTQLRATAGASTQYPWIMATASLALTKSVMEGAFRKDLFFMLSGLNVVLPPLRERDEDVLLFARAFVDGLAASLGRTSMRLAPESESRLLSYSWPRNIQELKGVCDYAVMACEGDRIELQHLFINSSEAPVLARPTDEGVKLSVMDWSLKSMERALIDRVLERAQNNITQAAKELGINRSTLYNKMREYQLGRVTSDFKEGA
jgi:DNA-binding NtrC family response regulator